MNMRNATCVGTQTSKAPTRVTLLFILYSVSERHTDIDLVRGTSHGRSPGDPPPPWKRHALFSTLPRPLRHYLYAGLRTE